MDKCVIYQASKWLVKLLYMDGLEKLGPLSHQTNLSQKMEMKTNMRHFNFQGLPIEFGALGFCCEGQVQKIKLENTKQLPEVKIVTRAKC